MTEPRDVLVLAADASAVGCRIDSWIQKESEGLTRTFIQKLIEEGCVQVGGIPVKRNYKLKEGDEVVLTIPLPVELNVLPENIPLDIVFEDEDIIIVNKQRGLVVHPAPGHPSGTLVNGLLYHCKESLSDINGVIRPGIVHRIDRDTTGLIVAAKNNQAHLFLSSLLKDHGIKRTYIALVDGVVKENSGVIDLPVGRHETDRKKMAVNARNGKAAVTRFTVAQRFDKKTLLDISLETGRTHQIRVHMAYIGYPVTGDPVYGKPNPAIAGQALHAYRLEFPHPSTKENVCFEATLPQDMQALIAAQ